MALTESNGPDEKDQSISAAIAQEMAASHESPQQLWLEIDGIEHLQNTQGKFVYRISLSTPVSFQSDQPLTFTDRETKDKISAHVLSCDDVGLLIETEQSLPAEARLMHVAFDPAFILKALSEFLERTEETPVYASVMGRKLSSVSRRQPVDFPSLNREQCQAISDMSSTPIHFLWGPPGTGKTTTIGMAIANWMRSGKSVLVVSTSNAAVDVAVRALLDRIEAKERKRVIRLGTSLDPKVSVVTPTAKLAHVDYQSGAIAQQTQDQLAVIASHLSHQTLSNETYQNLWAEKCRLESIIHQYNQKVEAYLPKALEGVSVVGCTLARMVLDKSLSDRVFDVVVVDEASMVSLVFAVAASKLAHSHLVYAGDPQQLPPICQSVAIDAQRWFGQSIYDFVGIGVNQSDFDTDERVSVLRTQYRMTEAIGGMVSRLSYGSNLKHGRQVPGEAVKFVEIPKEWQQNYYCVGEKSYYHPGIIPIVHSLAKSIGSPKDVLLLSPFRPQRSLLTALGFDLAKKLPNTKILASTIHRAQGSEASCVIVDLTTHSPEQIVKFFRDRHSSHLFNVAISRARDQLIIVGSIKVIEVLAADNSFWQKVLTELRARATIIPCHELLGDTSSLDDLKLDAADKPKRHKIPGIYSHDARNGALRPILKVFRASGSKRKLIVLPDGSPDLDTTGECVVRQSKNCPSLLSAVGVVCLPLNGRWVRTFSRNVASVLWRIGFSHLADDEIDPMQATRFFCPDCTNGNLVLKRVVGEGWFLSCTNSQVFECPYRRRLSLEDAKLKVRLSAMTCPSGHPLTARSRGNDYFLGCENYPHCEYTTPLSTIAGA